MNPPKADHGYGRPSWRPRVSAPATYRSGTPRNQHPAVASWHAHLRGLATAIHETSRLERFLAKGLVELLVGGGQRRWIFQ